MDTCVARNTGAVKCDSEFKAMIGYGTGYGDCVSTELISKDGITVAVIACC